MKESVMENGSMYRILLAFVIKWNLIFIIVRAETYNWVLFFLILSRILIIWNYIIILKHVFLKINFYKNNFLDGKDCTYIIII